MNSIQITKFIPLLNRVLIKRIPLSSQSKSGIVLTTNANKFTKIGVVMNVGPGRIDNNGKIIKPTVKDGDHVLLPDFEGNKLSISGSDDYIIYRDSDLMAVVEGTLH